MLKTAPLDFSGFPWLQNTRTLDKKMAAHAVANQMDAAREAENRTAADFLPPVAQRVSFATCRRPYEIKGLNVAYVSSKIDP